MRPARREMIIVTPDAFTKYQGSMYFELGDDLGSREAFITADLVTYTDAHYRQARRSERAGSGLVTSMGVLRYEFHSG